MNITANKNQLVLISGASRGIGKVFSNHYANVPQTKVVRISRNSGKLFTQLNLLDENSSLDFVKELDIQGIENILYMHAVGIDKFEPKGKPHIDFDGDGIDDEVYASNVQAFMNIGEPLVERTVREKIPMTVCNIGSISDIFNVPFWRSFSTCKNQVRRFCKSLNYDSVKSVFLNVSSTLDEEKRTYGRTKADIAYWQTVDELLAKALGPLELMRTLDVSYGEFDFYKHNPHFRPDYFTNLPKLFASWQRDMGYEGREIPCGIRI